MNVSQSQIVGLTYTGLAILAFVIFSKTFEWIWVSVDALEAATYFGILPLTSLLGLAAAAILMFALLKHPKVDPFIHETAVELRKVTWPNWKDTQRNTIQVTVFTVILSFFLWGADQVWRPVTDYILTLGF